VIDAPDAVIEIGGASIEADERAWLAERLARAVEFITSAPAGGPLVFARVDVRIVDDAEMSRLHDRAMGDPSTTDVLTWVERRADAALEVDLALCADEAARQAREHGHDRREELLLYGVHGLLHAAGFDDRDPTAFARLHAEEARIVAALGGRARVTPDEAPGPAPEDAPHREPRS